MDQTTFGNGEFSSIKNQFDNQIIETYKEILKNKKYQKCFGLANTLFQANMNRNGNRRRMEKLFSSEKQQETHN